MGSRIATIAVVAAALSATSGARAQDALQNLINAFPATNGTNQITGAQIKAMFQAAHDSALSSVNGKLDKAGGTITGALGFPSIAPLDLTYATTYASMANAMKLGAGNQISYCPELSCLSTSTTHGGAPYNDHQRTSSLISAQTQIDNQAEEQTLAINTLIGTGKRSAWTTSKAYAVNDNVLANGQIYRATVAGTSASSGSGPSGYGASGTQLQTDGSVTWKWINASAIATKLSTYIETAMEGGAGFSEGLVTNFQLLAAQYAPNGVAADQSQGAVGIEHDFSNFSGTDCGIGKCIGMSVAMSGPNSSWVGLQFDGGGGSHSGSQGSTAIGMRMGNRLATNADISIVDNAQVGLLIGNDDSYGGNSGLTGHSTASILDNSNSLVGINLAGSYTNGLSFNGSYSGAQIAGKGFAVDPTGGLTTFQVRVLPDTSHQFSMAYDVSNDRTDLQSIHLGSFNTLLRLNPAGGLVQAGISGFQTLGALSAPNLPTTAGTVKGSVCANSDGTFYVKTTTGSCV